MKLTAKQERFCQEYVIDNNGTQAAIRAGYSKRTAQEQASRLLSNVMVQARILELRADINEKLSLDAESVLSKFVSIANFSIKSIAIFDGKEFRLKPMSEWPEGAEVAIASLKGKGGNLEIKFESKLAACRSLGDHLGLFDGYEQIVKAAETYGKKLVDI